VPLDAGQPLAGIGKTSRDLRVVLVRKAAVIREALGQVLLAGRRGRRLGRRGSRLWPRGRVRCGCSRPACLGSWLPPGAGL